MTALDRLLATPRMIETDTVDLAASPARVWERIRHADLATSPLVRALFAIRTLPDQWKGDEAAPQPALRIDDIASTPDRPGFSVLAESPGREVAIGAIGKVWRPEIPFVHVADAEAFSAFSEEGFVKVAWALRVAPLGDRDSRVEVEVRVDATDEPSWKKFRAYFLLIGPGSRFIRHSLLAELAREFGTPEGKETSRPLPGDELLSDAMANVTQGITIRARPEAIWPWLVQMGCGRAGFYSYDMLDNGGVRSAREIHPELQAVRPGDVLPATPEGDDGFEVLRVDEPRVLVLGGLWDADAKVQRRFAARRPRSFWHVTWAFVLEPLDAVTTRLHVRARAAFPESGRLHASWIRPVHRFMQAAQLRGLAARAEGRTPRDDWHDVLEGAGGAAVMIAALLSPFSRSSRNHWGVDEATAARPHPGDDLVSDPLWSWTHGVEIDAPAGEVWPWVAQIGADRGGFYSYQWLENIAGCELRNAETIHPEWAHREGDGLVLHPRMPPMRVVSVAPGRHLLAHAPADEAARSAGAPWASVSWLFLVEPIGSRRCRLVSRYRCACSGDLATRMSLGPTLVEPIGFAMDRRMLLGIKERAERGQNDTVAFAPGAG